MPFPRPDPSPPRPPAPDRSPAGIAGILAGALAAAVAARHLFGLFLRHELDHVQVVSIALGVTLAACTGSLVLRLRDRAGRPPASRGAALARGFARGLLDALALLFGTVAAIVGGLVLLIGWGLSRN